MVVQGAFLEQNLLLNRKNEITDECYVNQRNIAQNAHVFICTTMYHEAEHEMEQLLNSIHDIDSARSESQRNIESHIWFDGAVKGETFNSYVLQVYFNYRQLCLWKDLRSCKYCLKQFSGLNGIRTHDICEAGADALSTEQWSHKIRGRQVTCQMK